MSEAPAIDARLSRLAGPVANGDVVTVVRDYLAAVMEQLSTLHQGTRSGLIVNEAHSDFVDRLIRRLFELAEERWFSDGGEADTDLTVLAVGGYARREMSIHSDVDLLFLYRQLTPFVKSVVGQVQTWMWDASLQVGSAARNIRETMNLARKDTTVRTALLEHRFLVGSGVLFHEFTGTLRAELFSNPERFIVEQIDAVRERHAQYGESLYLLQPNLKEGAGGLRDYHASYWAMQATQPNARGRDDFLHLGLLTADEIAEYRAALDFLWRVRNELHFISGRKNDRMSFELQERIALAFGYGDGEEERPDLPVEAFMSEYYRRARAIRNYASLVIEQCHARVRRAPRRRRVKEVEHGFRIANNQLEIPHARQLREDPLGLLRAFFVAQHHGVDLTRKARRLLGENLGLIDDEFRRSPEARDVLLSILDCEQRVALTLTAMNEVGVLAAYLPEWEHVVCRWQQVMFHTYTVDVHTIFLVEELRFLWRGDFEKELPELTQLVRGVDDRTVLFLGCLFHDIGKGLGGNHSQRGTALTRACLERIGLEPERIERVVFLVEQHLVMSQIAQSRDLSDAKLIFDFARTVKDRTNLHFLYLLTFADTRASSKTAWTPWKGQLLRELFERTSELLETGAEDASVAIDLIERRVERRRESAGAALSEANVSDEKIRSYFEMMPRRYFIAHGPKQIARHAEVVLGLGPDRVMNTAVREMRGDFSELLLCTNDTHALHAKVAGTLTAHAINILGAHVYTTRSGLALEVYRVTTPPGGEGERKIVWQEFEGSLEAVLRGDLPVEELLRRRGRPVGITRSPSRSPASVEASNDESDFYTIVDVTANDRLGLLYDLTRVIAAFDLEIYISKAATVLDQVKDTFYLKSQGGKLQDPALLERLKADLLAAAQHGDGDGAVARRDG